MTTRSAPTPPGGSEISSGSTTAVMSDHDRTAFRQRHYNAVVSRIVAVHRDLIRMTVRPDTVMHPPRGGQYVTLGLGRFERRVEGCQDDPYSAKEAAKLVRRAYSLSCPMLDGDALAPVSEADEFEFYVVLVRENDGDPPLLTPRLFGLEVGDRLAIGKKFVGTYTTEGVGPDDTVLMIGTGTGEAPHNAMATELLAAGQRGAIVNVTTVRHAIDSGYDQTHEHLHRRYANYHRVLLTTRDPVNVDPAHPGFVGKRYVQQLLTDGSLSDRVGVAFSPSTTHIFLCGNPAMIGYAPPGGEPAPGGLLPLLTAAGYRDGHAPDVTPGSGVVRFEKYW